MTNFIILWLQFKLMNFKVNIYQYLHLTPPLPRNICLKKFQLKKKSIWTFEDLPITDVHCHCLIKTNWTGLYWKKYLTKQQLVFFIVFVHVSSNAFMHSYFLRMRSEYWRHRFGWTVELCSSPAKHSLKKTAKFAS